MILVNLSLDRENMEGAYWKAMVMHHLDNGGHEESAKFVIDTFKFLKPVLT